MTLRTIRKMKISKYVAIAVAAIMPMCMQSCLGDDDDDIRNYPTALVTVVPQADGGFVMNLDENTTLVPDNMKASPFGTKEVRALVNYTEVGSRTSTRRVQVNWIDSIRTKMPEKSLGSVAADDAKYGIDPVEVINDWVTVAEDGYLTLRFRTIWGDRGIKHAINLVTDTDADNPYALELRHNANGDVDGVMGDALVAFNLNDIDFGDKDTVKFTITWTSFAGKQSATFDLKKRTPAASGMNRGMAYSIYVK